MSVIKYDPANQSCTDGNVPWQVYADNGVALSWHKNIEEALAAYPDAAIDINSYNLWIEGYRKQILARKWVYLK